MNIKVIAGVGIVSIIIIGLMLAMNNSSATLTIPSQQDSMMKASITNPPQAMLKEQPNTKYREFDSMSLKDNSTAKRLLFFYAAWCPTCQAADQSILSNIDKIPADLTIIKVNYNDQNTDQIEKELAQKYGITYQHTFVQIDDQGNEITKWNGGNIDQIMEKVK